MFTGIVADCGIVTEINKNGDWDITIKTRFDTSLIDIGASIACEGVCLTVIERQEDCFKVQASSETLSCTTISDWTEGKEINLEKSLKLGDELGGHLVYGHVDGLVEVVSIKLIEDSHEIVLETSDELSCFIAAKGSITLNGVSLTVNKINGNKFTVNLISHTWEVTTLRNLNPGDKINMEIDMLARYVARMINKK